VLPEHTKSAHTFWWAEHQAAQLLDAPNLQQVQQQQTAVMALQYRMSLMY
jgi:hypothetical protein